MSHLSGSSSQELQGSTDFGLDYGTCGESCDRNDASQPPARLDHRDLQRMIDARRLRSKFFDANLFADPAWDILLDLYRAHLAQQRICITSVCFGSGVPVSTALRWLNALEQRGLTKRSNDPLDARRSFVALTPKGVSAMAGYFAATE
jgi:DNA-binding MarR family transcriptional regulator